MKKLLSILLCMVLLLSVVPVFTITASAATSGYYTYTVSDGEATITSCKRSVSGDIIIPSTLGGYKVTEIGTSAFTYCESITSVIIPDGVIKIANGAFRQCISLTSVTIPNSVISIYGFAFNECDALTSIVIPESVTHIEDLAFAQCDSLTSIVVDTDNIAYTDVNGVLFNKSKTLLHTYPSGKTATAYTIPDSVTSIGRYAFYYCDSLTSITIPDSVTSMGENAIDHCRSLTSVIIPAGVTSIDRNFNSCTALTSITILNPECYMNVLPIPSSATIYGYAGSTAEKYATYNNLTFVELTPANACGEDAMWGFDESTGTLTIYGNGAMYDYENVGNTVPWLEYRTQLTNVVISDGITYIGNRAFRGMNYLTDVKFGASVESTGYEVFMSCSRLANVELNEGLTSIGSLAFYNCTSLTAVDLPSTLTMVNNRAFKGSGLTSVSLPDSVISVGYEVFMNCADLATVKYSAGCSMLNPRMFENCTSLKEFTVTDNLCRVRSRAFYGCTALEKVTFEDENMMWGSSNGLEARIASNSFEGCNSTLVLVSNIDNGYVEEYTGRFGFQFEHN